MDIADVMRLLEELVAPGPVGFAVIDRNFRYLTINECLAQTNGRPRADHIGKTVAEMVGDEVWPILRPHIETAFTGEQVTGLHLSSPPGTDPAHSVHCELAYLPICSGNEVAAVVGLIRDYSKRALAEQALQETEQRFHRLVEIAEEGIWIHDADAITTFINPQMARMLGYKVEEVMGRPVFDFMDDEVKRNISRTADPTRRKNRETYDMRFRRKDGSPMWGLIARNPVLSETGEYLGAVGMISDITSRKRDEIERERLLKQEQNARHMLEVTLGSITDAFISVDTNWVYTYINPSAARLIGASPPELLGKSIWKVSPEAVGRPFYEACMRSMREREPVEIEELEDLSGRWFEYRLYPSQEGLSVFFQEITARKAAEKEKNELLRRIEESSAQQQAFLRDMLWSVTGQRLRLCWASGELPARLPTLYEHIAQRAPHGMGDLRDGLREVGLTLDFTRQRLQDLIIGASEAAMNCIVHGGGGQAKICGREDGPIQVWIDDEGAGIAMEHVPRAVLERGYTTAGTMGHGMKMILQTVDRVWLMTGTKGTTIVLEQDKTAPPAPLF